MIPDVVQPFFAITRLTIKAAFRYRLAPLMLVVLCGVILAIPLLIRDMGSAQIFTQVTLNYSLSLVTLILGFSTLWMSCGTLAHDIADSQIQMVAVKPVHRWQIWLGKWLGLVLLNLGFLAVGGALVLAVLFWRASGLDPEQREVLENKVLVSRGSLIEPVPFTWEDVEKEFEKKWAVLSSENRPSPSLMKRQIAEDLERSLELIRPNYLRRWTIDVSHIESYLKDKPLHLRVRFYAAQATSGATGDGSFLLEWQVGRVGKGKIWRHDTHLTPDAFHEFEVPAGYISDDGNLYLEVINHNPVSVVFTLDDGLEVLYPAGGFLVNYVRALMVILCWMALLAALGLASAGFLSFPVASFLVFSLLMVFFSSNLIADVVREGTISSVDHETGRPTFGYLDWFLVPVFQLLLMVVNVVREVSPIEAVATGRAVPWWHLTRAFFQLVVLLGGLIGLAGMLIFSRRELATAAQSQS